MFANKKTILMIFIFLFLKVNKLDGNAKWKHTSSSSAEK